MIRKKNLLSKFLYLSGIVNYFHNKGTPRLLIFNFHRLINQTNYDDTFYDLEVFGPNEAEFEIQMKWLKKNVDILSETDLLLVLNNEKKLSRPSLMITFDDGYIDNYTTAYPILKKLGIPAIFFIPTKSINERKLGWWDIISFIINKTNKTNINYNDTHVDLRNKRSAIKYFFNKMKNDLEHETKNTLKTLSDECEVPFPKLHVQSDELMTWSQIREMSDNGMTIGSHTHSHRVLSTLPFFQQKNEMVDSKSMLEENIGHTVKSISYPVGYYTHFSKETRQLAFESGYDLGFSFNTGINYYDKLIPFDVKRIEAENNIDMIVSMTYMSNIFIKKHNIDLIK